jgi:hypothetical protein
MSLAMYAAPFNNNDYMDKINDTDTPIGRKKNSNNKTQKRYYSAPPKDNNNTDKINNILRTIHNLPERNDDEELADFNELLPPPISAGVEQTKAKEGFGTANQLSAFISPANNNNSPEMDDNSKSIYSNLNAQTNDMSFASSTDYSRFIPDYTKMYGSPSQTSGGQKQQISGFNGSKGQNDVLMEKLNYMITLLEQQESDKTNNVTEEVILYSFLGIFIIFIVDSFARVGKYVR